MNGEESKLSGRAVNSVRFLYIISSDEFEPEISSSSKPEL